MPHFSVAPVPATALAGASLTKSTVSGVPQVQSRYETRTDLKLVRTSNPVGIRVSTRVGISRRTLSSRRKRTLVHGRSLTVSRRSVVGSRGRSPALSGGGTAVARVMWHETPKTSVAWRRVWPIRLESRAVQPCCKVSHKLSSRVPGSTVDRRLPVNSGAAREIAQNGHVS